MASLPIHLHHCFFHSSMGKLRIITVFLVVQLFLYNVLSFHETNVFPLLYLVFRIYLCVKETNLVGELKWNNFFSLIGINLFIFYTKHCSISLFEHKLCNLDGMHTVIQVYFGYLQGFVVLKWNSYLALALLEFQTFNI